MTAVDTKKLEQFETQLHLMRKDTADYALDPNHDPDELLRRRGDCAELWGAIECYKKGETPVIESQAKYLR
jgi:hypothetical protein